MKSISFILLCIYFFSVPALVYAQDITGSIEGMVIDTIGSPLSGVNISLQSENLQGIQGTSTNDKGFFRIFALPIGTYKVKVSFIGYREIIFENVQISLGRTTNLGQIKLGPLSYSLPEVVVSGEKFSIDPTSTTYGGNLNAREFENLPVDRNYQSMISLLPQANASYFGDGVNIGGATGFENKYFVDGVEVTDPLLGDEGTSLPYNFIKEIEVKTGGYEAEFRSSLGGLINVVTHSGTNELHGSVFGFYTNNHFSRKRLIGTLDPAQGDFSNYDVGVSLGGPIIRDELWFFAAYNPTFNLRDTEVPSFGVSIDKTIRHSFASKLTWSVSQKLKLIFTITGDPTERKAIGYDITNYPIAGLLNPDPFFQDLQEGGVNISLNGTYSMGQNILLRGFFSRIMKYDSGEPSTARGKDEILFWDFQTNIWGGGTYRKWDTYRYSNVGKLNGIFMFGLHILNAGIEYKDEGVDNQNYYAIVVRGDSLYWVKFIGIGGKIYQRIPSVFLQDSWQITKSLNIHGGARWDAQFITAPNGDLRQKVKVPLQPRIGFTFLPDENGKQKIFGSFSRFAQEFSLFSSVDRLTDSTATYTITYDHDPRISSAGGDTSGGIVLFTLQHEAVLNQQFFDEFNLGYEYAFGDNFYIGVQGTYRTLKEAIGGSKNLGSGVISYMPRPKRNYTALTITIEHQKGEHFNFLASYVLSRQYGNYGGLIDAVTHVDVPNMNFYVADSTGTYQTQIENGLLPNDRTHVFKFSGSYKFSFGLTAGITFTAQTGTPLSKYGSDELNNILLSPRGTAGRTPSIWDLNARFIYEIPYLYNWNTRLILDIFNIASQRKPVDVNQYRYLITSDGRYIPSPSYGQAYRFQPAMSVRLGMEVNF